MGERTALGGWIVGALALVAVLGAAARVPAQAGDLVVRVRDSGGEIRAVDLETYVERSVAAEVYASWPAQALRAQAVVARTYVLHQRQVNGANAHDVESSVLSQRYRVGRVSERVRAATEATRGEYLAFGPAQTPILAAFHSSAGGRTAAAGEVWGLDLPYLRPVDSPDDAAPDFFWSYEIDVEDLRAALIEAGWPAGTGTEVRIVDRSPSGRARRAEVLGLDLSGRELRQVLGGRALRSALFDVRVDGAVVRFLGSGAGHGVGLCQWGTRELARRGRSYSEILAHYYPGTTLRRIGDPADVASGSRAR